MSQLKSLVKTALRTRFNIPKRRSVVMPMAQEFLAIFKASPKRVATDRKMTT